MMSSARPTIAYAAILTCLASGGCGYTIRAGAGPTFTSDGRTGFEVGGELAGHLLGSKSATMPVGLRAHVAWIEDEAIGFIGVTIAADAVPRFYRDDPGPGFAGRLGGAVGGVVHSPDATFGLRTVLGLGAGERRASQTKWTRYDQIGVEAAWQGDFGRPDMAPEGTPLKLQYWRMTPALYAEVTWQEAVHFWGIDW